MACVQQSASSTYTRGGEDRTNMSLCHTHRLMWISKGVPKNFSRIAHGFCWSLAQVQGQGCFTQAAKCSKCRLKYSTHGFDQTDLMSFKLVLIYPLIKHILPDDVDGCLSGEKRKKSEIICQTIGQLSQQTQNLVVLKMRQSSILNEKQMGVDI